MPRAAKRKIVDNQVYESWCAFAADGLPGVIARGTRLRGSDPVVKAHSYWFVPAGTPASEWPAELGTDKDSEPTPEPECDIRLRVEPQPLGDMCELVNDVTVLTGATGERAAGGGHPGKVVTYKPGTRFDAGALIVARLPNAFREV